MKQITQKIRTSGICFITAAAISLSATSHAGWFDNAKNKVNSVKTKVSNKTSKIRSNVNQKIANNDIINTVKKLEVKDQLTNMLDLMKEMQRDYNYFSGGSGCGGECANFRFQLKEAFYEYILLAKEVPSLNADGMLIKNLERAVDLIQARLEHIAWLLNTSADIIPDTNVEGEVGAAAGVFGSAGVGSKPTDQIKILFKVIAAVPQQISWSIKINTLRAATVCKRIEKRNSP